VSLFPWDSGASCYGQGVTAGCERASSLALRRGLAFSDALPIGMGLGKLQRGNGRIGRPFELFGRISCLALAYDRVAYQGSLKIPQSSMAGTRLIET